MDNKYWELFYKNIRFDKPSGFAVFVKDFLPPNCSIVDIGCGDGRDSYYFAKQGFKVTGIDYAVKPKDKKNVVFKKVSIQSFKDQLKDFDVVYSRFTLNSVSPSEISTLLYYSYSSLFATEFRNKGDKPKVFPNHRRNFIDGNLFMNRLLEHNFDILFYKKGRGMAVYKNENPLVTRVVAKGCYYE